MSPHADALRRATRRRILRFNRRQALGQALTMMCGFGAAGALVVLSVECYQELNRLKTIRAETISRWRQVDFLEAHPQCDAVDVDDRRCRYFGDHPGLDHLFGGGDDEAFTPYETKNP